MQNIMEKIQILKVCFIMAGEQRELDRLWLLILSAAHRVEEAQLSQN